MFQEKALSRRTPGASNKMLPTSNQELCSGDIYDIVRLLTPDVIGVAPTLRYSSALLVY